MEFAQGKVTSPLLTHSESLEEMMTRYVAWYGPFQDGCLDDLPRERDAFLSRFGDRITGTVITFLPDGNIFETTEFDYDVLAHRLREIAFLNSGIRIVLHDLRSGDREVFYYEGGTAEYVRFLNTGETPIHPDVITLGRKDPENRIEVEAALQYTTAYSEQVFSYVNSVNTARGGLTSRASGVLSPVR